MTFVLGTVLSTTWLCIAVLSRLEPAVYLPQAVRFLGASLVLLVLGWVFARRLPRISLRLFHAAITVAALAYVLSPVLAFYSLRTVSSGLGALVYVSLPIWFLLVAYGEGSSRLWQHLFVVIGLVLVAIGSWDQSELRGSSYLPLFTLVAGMVAFMAGVWVSRRLFWLHSAMDLNFWSMLFAGIAHCLLAMTVNEFGHLFRWTATYWQLLLFFSFVVTGLGAYFYRVRQGTTSSVVLTALTPLLALGLAFAAWEETPINIATVTGAVLVIGVLILNAMHTLPNRWLVLYLNNDKRQGDRLVCLLQGEILRSDGTKLLIQIIDIGIGGLGFRSAGSLSSGEKVQVVIPVAHQNNRLTLDCQVAYAKPNNSREFPVLGGLQFYNVSESRWQNLVEFLARLTQAEEE
jgi:drug/metabolite transporter (DMT)-like permease